MRRKPEFGRWEPVLRFMLLLAALVGTLALLLVGGRWLESRSRKPEARGDYQQRYEYDENIVVNGETYRRRRDVAAILLMGIDRDSNAEVIGYRNGGQADFLQLMAIDDANERITRILIDRDTMTPITVLGVLGNQSGVRTAQICLSHGFGDGGAQSCELTADAVSNLLLGVPIDEYLSMNLDGIPVLNDAVGGVTVTLEDDFTALDPAMKAGITLTLHGKQAAYFVRNRMNIGIGTNEARMKRQQMYMSSLSDLLDERVRTDQNAIGQIYDELEPYLKTSMARGYIINKAWAAHGYARDVREIAGKHCIGSDGFMEFHADEAFIEALVLELFYQKVK